VALVAVTDHAVERYGQRVRGTLDPRAEIVTRVGEAVQAGRVEPGERGAQLVRDLRLPGLVYVCMEDRPRGELIVVTLYEEGEDQRFTNALRRPR
jgi:Ribonuclease G/E